MNQAILFQFSIVKNDRVYQISLQPGSPWEEIDEVIKEFQQKFIDLKIEAKKKETEQTEAQ